MDIIFHTELNEINYFLLLPAALFFTWFYNLFKNRGIGVTIVPVRVIKYGLFYIMPGKQSEEKIKEKFKFYYSPVYLNAAKTKIYSLFFLLCTLFALVMCFIEIVDNRF